MVDITIQYKDGGTDRYRHAKVISTDNGILEIWVSDLLTVCIVIANITFWRVEEVSNEEDSIPF